MKISIVVAVGQYGEIGAQGELLWRLPKDMQFFKETTLHHHVVMGRVTYESIPTAYRPLVDRVNLVLSHSDTPMDGAIVLPSIDAAIDYAQAAGETELMIIGGATIYRQTIARCQKIYLTRVNEVFPEADAHFPAIRADWSLRSSEHYAADKENPHSMDFEVWERV